MPIEFRSCFGFSLLLEPWNNSESGKGYKGHFLEHKRVNRLVLKRKNTWKHHTNLGMKNTNDKSTKKTSQ